MENYVQRINETVNVNVEIWECARLCLIFNMLRFYTDQYEEHMKSNGDLVGRDIRQAKFDMEYKYTTGVSYVLESESQQESVSDKFKRLPHTIIQPPNLKFKENSHIKNLIYNLNQSNVITYITTVKDDNEYKEYLLNPKYRYSYYIKYLINFEN